MYNNDLGTLNIHLCPLHIRPLLGLSGALFGLSVQCIPLIFAVRFKKW